MEEGTTVWFCLPFPRNLWRESRRRLGLSLEGNLVLGMDIPLRLPPILSPTVSVGLRTAWGSQKLTLDLLPGCYVAKSLHDLGQVTALFRAQILSIYVK